MSNDSPATDPFQPDPVNYQFLLASRTSTSTTSTSRSSSTSSGSMMTSMLPINARSAAETKSLKRSLLKRLQAL